MSANNNGVFIGNVGSDPEVKPAGTTQVAKFSLAVRRPMKGRDGSEVTDWFRVTLWGKQAELAGDLIRKGTKLAVCGAIHIETWTGNDGTKQTSVIINADGFELLSPKQQDQNQQRQAPAQQRTADPGRYIGDGEIPPF